MKGMKVLFFVMLISVLIASLWNAVPIIKQTVNLVLNPTIGSLLGWNLTVGMFIVVFFISLMIVLFHKFASDQETLKELKGRQKAFQEEAKQYKSDPKKMLEINKKSMELFPELMSASSRPLLFTAIPLIFSIIFSSILRKVLKVH